MSAQTGIEWTDATWNPVTGCSLASPGCTNCYAMKLAGTRLRHHPSRKGLTKVVNGHSVWTGEVRFNEQWLNDPLRWRKPSDIFVCAHADLFHPKVPRAWIERIFDVMQRGTQHRYQVLTKRDAIMCALLTRDPFPVLPHVWLGVSVEDQQRSDERRESLRKLSLRGWKTFCSYEPALGPVDWTGWEFLDGMISGGESGPRPSHPDWHRGARDFCATNGIRYCFKQHGAWTVIVDRDRDDPDWRADYGVVNRKPDYRILNLAGGIGFHGDRVLLMRRVGKKAAGRLLDGRLHDDFPGPLTSKGESRCG